MDNKKFSIAPTVCGVVGMIAAPVLAPIAGTAVATSALVGGAGIVCSGVVGFIVKHKSIRIGVNKDTVNHILDNTGLKNAAGQKPTVTDVVKHNKYTDVYVQIPPGIRKEDFDKKAIAIGDYFHNTAVVMTPQNENTKKRFDRNKNGRGVYKVRVYTTYLPTLIPFKVTNVENYIKSRINQKSENKQADYRREFNNSLWLCYGESRDGLEWLNMAEEYVLIAGEKGSGKSVLLRGLLCQLIDNYEPGKELILHLNDFKSGIELGDFKHVKHCEHFSKDEYEFDAYLTKLTEEMERRYAIIQSIPRCKKLSEYNNAVSDEERMPFLVCVIEEFAKLMGMDANKEDKKIRESIMAKLAVLLAQARAAGILFVITTQRPCKEYIPSIIKTNIDVRFALRTVDGNNSKVIIDCEGCESLRGNGHGILKDGAKLIEFQSMKCDSEDAYRIITKHEKPLETVRVISNATIIESFDSNDDLILDEIETQTLMHDLLQSSNTYEEHDDDDIVNKLIIRG